MATHRKRPDPTVAKVFRFGRQNSAGQNDFRAAHPIASSVIHVVGEGIAKSLEAIDDALRRGDFVSVKALISHNVIGMKMRVVNARDRLARQVLGELRQRFAETMRRPGIDDDRAGRGIKDRDVGDGAAILHRDRFLSAA